MKQPGLPFKTRRMILNIITAVFAVAMLLFYKFFTATALGISILIIFLIVFCILLHFWWRCPHCDTFFIKLSPFAEHCPYCGNELE